MFDVYVDDDCLQAIVFWGSSCFAVRRSDCPVFLSGTFSLFSPFGMSNTMRVRRSMVRMRLQLMRNRVKRKIRME